MKGSERGMTLIELLITIGITVIVATASTVYFFQFRGSQDLDNDEKRMVAVLRDAQERALTRESGWRWGVCFQNNSSGRDYYYLISYADSYTNSFQTAGTCTSQGNTATTSQTYILGTSTEINSTSIVAGNIRNYIFEKNTGELMTPSLPMTNTMVFDRLNNTSDTRTITINTNGTVTYQ